MNTLISQIQIWTKIFSKVSLLTFIFFAFQQTCCSTQSPDDPFWQKQSTDQYIYSINIQIFPAHAYCDELFLEPEISITQHYFNSGLTRTKINREILDNGSIRKTTEIWITKNPTYCTYQNAVFVTGIVISITLIHLNQGTILDWWNPKTISLPRTQDNSQKPGIPIAESASKISPETASVKENKSSTPIHEKFDEYGDPIIEKASGLEALQYFLRGLTAEELESQQKQLEKEQKEKLEYIQHAEEFWAKFWASQRKNRPNNAQEAWNNLKNNTNDIVSYFFTNTESPQDSNVPTASTNESDNKTSTK